MCGIAGIAPRDPAHLLDRTLVQRMCDQIIHRGPDDEGIYASPGIGMGMRRLAIIDLSAGNQPIHNEDNTVWLVFNGEIYNYRELRVELLEAGHRFYTESDSEVIVHAYEQWGVAAFERLRGMFAISLWDTRTQELVLARDRFGKKPLFVAALEDGALAFASELKSLTVVPSFRMEIDPGSVYEYLLMGYVPTPRSPFKGVRKMEPGTWLRWKAGKVETGSYWSLPFGPKWVAPHEELVERLASEVEEAVRVRLVSDVPFGAFLSGGLDSSVVVAYMARHMSEPVRTFTIGFNAREFDETEDARRIASHFGTRHEELYVEPDAVSLLDKIVHYLDEPFGDSSAIPTFLVSQLAAGHVKMVLSGDGGDEMFGGYTRYGKYLTLRRMRSMGAGLLSPLLAGASHLGEGRLQQRLALYADRLSAPYPDSYLRGVALMSPAAARALLASGVPAGERYGSVSARFSAAGIPGGDGLDSIIRGDIHSYLLDDILVKVDRMTMANSLESRSPLLDHKLAEFAARLPEDEKWRDGKGKQIFRDVAARVLPPESLTKRKQGFAIPLAAWFRGPLHAVLMDTLAEPTRCSGLLDYARIRRLAEAHRAGSADHAETLWLALCLERWWMSCLALRAQHA